MRCRGVDVKLKAVLFDLDGTLIDSKKDIAAAANAARVHFGMPALPLEVVTGYIGWGIDHLNRKTLGTEDPARLAEGLEVLKAHYRDHCVDQTLIFPGVKELLDFLKAKGVKMGLVSNKPHEFTLITLEKLGLMPYFMVALGADATPNKKPHPEPLLVALQKMGVGPAEAVMIGDSPVDIQAARAAGMLVGVVEHGFVAREHLASADPDWLVNNLEEFIEILT
ncbi:MAG TPA: phosphoglycolate phosphatase [bacterium]|nr:phosphoglycolate phosphatase [bacterium]